MWFSLKCHKEGAWIFPWAEIFVQWSTNLLLVPFSPGLQGSGSINDLKMWTSFICLTQLNENTVANRNLLSSIIQILTFIPL